MFHKDNDLIRFKNTQTLFVPNTLNLYFYSLIKNEKDLKIYLKNNNGKTSLEISTAKN